MSVSTMGELAQNNAPQPANALKLIAAYIPSEAVALYLAALGILMPAEGASEEVITRVRLICFVIGLAAALVISIIGVDAAQVKPRQTKKFPWDEWTWYEPWRRRVVVALLAGIAFVFYAAATPSFFYDNTYLTIQFTQWAAVAAILCAVVLPLAAKPLGVRGRTDQ